MLGNHKTEIEILDTKVTDFECNTHCKWVENINDCSAKYKIILLKSYD